MCTTVAGQFGNAISFAGATTVCVATVPHDTDLQGSEFTYETWFKFVGGAGTQVGRIAYERVGQTEFPWSIEFVPNTPNASSMRLRAKIKTIADGEVTVHTHTMAEDGNFHHVAWSYDAAGNSVLYVDNAVVGTVVAPVANIAMQTGEDYQLIVNGNLNWAFDNFYWANVAHDAVAVADHFTNGV